MITAGDGRRFARRTSGTWMSIHSGSVFTAEEIAALGPVRRAVVVTVPDYPGETSIAAIDFVTYEGAEEAKDFAAELLAAALHAEGDA